MDKFINSRQEIDNLLDVEWRTQTTLTKYCFFQDNLTSQCFLDDITEHFFLITQTNYNKLRHNLNHLYCQYNLSHWYESQEKS